MKRKIPAASCTQKSHIDKIKIFFNFKSFASRSEIAEDCRRLQKIAEDCNLFILVKSFQSLQLYIGRNLLRLQRLRRIAKFCNRLGLQISICNILGLQISFCNILGLQILICNILGLQISICNRLGLQILICNRLGLQDCNLWRLQSCNPNILQSQSIASNPCLHAILAVRYFLP